MVASGAMSTRSCNPARGVEQAQCAALEPDVALHPAGEIERRGDRSFERDTRRSVERRGRGRWSGRVGVGVGAGGCGAGVGTGGGGGAGMMIATRSSGSGSPIEQLEVEVAAVEPDRALEQECPTCRVPGVPELGQSARRGRDRNGEQDLAAGGGADPQLSPGGGVIVCVLR